MKEWLKSLTGRLRRTSAESDEDQVDMSPVTTGGGDDGRSSLFSGERYFKDTAVFEALGDIDELNSWLGVIRTREGARDHVSIIHEIQDRLGRGLATCATIPSSSLFSQLTHVSEQDIRRLEQIQASLKKTTEIPPRFIVPGEFDGVVEIDVARAITRRCERRVVHMIRDMGRSDVEVRRVQVYLNRLSDFLFVLGRAVEQAKNPEAAL